MGSARRELLPRRAAVPPPSRSGGAAGARRGRLLSESLWVGSCEPWLLRDGALLSPLVRCIQGTKSCRQMWRLASCVFPFTWWFDLFKSLRGIF